nr:hypothetical protein [Mycoplasmopsis bovis]
MFIQPMYVALSRGTKKLESIRESIRERRIKAYYDFIWENYKASW